MGATVQCAVGMQTVMPCLGQGTAAAQQRPGGPWRARVWMLVSSTTHLSQQPQAVDSVPVDPRIFLLLIDPPTSAGHGSGLDTQELEGHSSSEPPGCSGSELVQSNPLVPFLHPSAGDENHGRHVLPVLPAPSCSLGQSHTRVCCSWNQISDLKELDPRSSDHSLVVRCLCGGLCYVSQPHSQPECTRQL